MLTPRENLIRFLKEESTEWMPGSPDFLPFNPEEIPENVCRGFVSQQNPFPKEKFGGRGFFGVDWIFKADVGGSMEIAPLFEDIEDWEEKVEWPDLDKIDWEGIKERNKDYLKTDKLIRTTIFTGFYERLISFVGFENAAVALVDEDQVEYVHKLFDRLADLYIDFIQRMHRNYNVEYIELHDDWGTQRSTMFSFDTHREVIVPYVRKVVEGAHKEGCFVEMHSCGMIDPLFPNFIEAGFDTWRGQATAVDKRALVERYGDQFKFGVEIRPAPTATAEEVTEMCRKFKEDYAGKRIWLSFSALMPKYQYDIINKEIYGR